MANSYDSESVYDHLHDFATFFNGLFFKTPVDSVLARRFPDIDPRVRKPLGLAISVILAVLEDAPSGDEKWGNLPTGVVSTVRRARTIYLNGTG